MKTSKFFLVMLFLLCSCTGTYRVIDNYIVSYYNAKDPKSSDYSIELFCNPGCEQDPVVDNVKSISWNKRTMVIEQWQSDENKWYFVLCAKDSLMCCCRDTLLGPFSEHEKDSVLEARQIDISKMEEKKWRSPF